MGMNLRLLGVAAVSAALISTTAVAAPQDGFYVGLQLGVVSGEVEQSNENATQTFNNSFNYALDSGALIGGHAGYSMLVDGITLGIEGDYEAGDISGNGTRVCTAVCLAAPDNVHFGETDADWMASIRGRVGVMLSPAWHVFGTGGWAYSESEDTLGLTTSIGSPALLLKASREGFTWGLGVEARATSSVTVRLEYREVDFDEASATSVPNNWHTDQDMRVQSIRAAASFWFN